MRFTAGVILVLAGLVSLAIPNFTFFTSENLANTGYFNLDHTQPHSVVIHPFVSVVTLITGVVLILFSRKQRD